jgi:hypothetical protein
MPQREFLIRQFAEPAIVSSLDRQHGQSEGVCRGCRKLGAADTRSHCQDAMKGAISPG